MIYITCPQQVSRPFSLTCLHCDAGQDIESPEQAVSEGWTEIEEVDLVEANYMGICPACQIREEQS